MYPSDRNLLEDAFWKDFRAEIFRLGCLSKDFFWLWSLFICIRDIHCSLKAIESSRSRNNCVGMDLKLRSCGNIPNKTYIWSHYLSRSQFIIFFRHFGNKLPILRGFFAFYSTPKFRVLFVFVPQCQLPANDCQILRRFESREIFLKG